MPTTTGTAGRPRVDRPRPGFCSCIATISDTWSGKTGDLFVAVTSLHG